MKNTQNTTKSLRILWKQYPVKGRIETVRCNLMKMVADSLSGSRIDAPDFELSQDPCALTLTLDSLEGGTGTCEPTVTVWNDANPFTFRVRDVCKRYPIYIREYEVIVTAGDDPRPFEAIAAGILEANLPDAIGKLDREPEESFEEAVQGTFNFPSPTWLGISRDIRLFEVGYVGMPTYENLFATTHDYIKPRLGSWSVKRYKDLKTDYLLRYFIGRGVSCARDMKRSLEDGYLPILNTEFEDGKIHYSMQYFTTLEQSPLTSDNVEGTHYLVADANFSMYNHTPEQTREKEALWDTEMDFKEEVVLYFRVIAENKNPVPVYAFVEMPSPIGPSVIRFDEETGLGTVEDEKVFMIYSVNGRPIPQKETAILIPPGEKAEYLFIIPHNPISVQRAQALQKHSYEKRLIECKAFWNEKLEKAMHLNLPEKRIEHMMKAGFIHLDLLCMGKEPDGPLAPNIGFYCPIGSESSPIVQYLAAVGRTDLSERAMNYFFAKQHEDGFIQNFKGYMLETGAVLWTAYLHFLYTGHTDWVRTQEEKIAKSADYLIAWADRNRREELRGRGYGMLEGKVADPEDPYHSYMLNAYAYAGLIGSANMLQKIGSAHRERISRGAAELKAHILTAFRKSVAESPVIPLGSGLWCPSAAPWPEYRGPLCISTDGGNFSTHGSITSRDSLLGPMYLLYLHVIEPKSTDADFLMRSFAELLYQRHTAFSQPYYSPHGLVNLRRGERKAFIKEFYNGFAGLADRHTYTFWEHFHLVSIHKTHEEAWFLMRCRNMLYTEIRDFKVEENDGQAGKTKDIKPQEELCIMPGVPSAWFTSRKLLSVEGANTYYGSLSFSLEHEDSSDIVRITGRLEKRGDQAPRIRIRVPLPEGLRITSDHPGFDIADDCELVSREAIDQFALDIHYA
jgi:hypothetical protein